MSQERRCRSLRASADSCVHIFSMMKNPERTWKENGETAIGNG